MSKKLYVLLVPDLTRVIQVTGEAASLLSLVDSAQIQPYRRSVAHRLFTGETEVQLRTTIFADHALTVVYLTDPEADPQGPVRRCRPNDVTASLQHMAALRDLAPEASGLPTVREVLQELRGVPEHTVRLNSAREVQALLSQAADLGVSYRMRSAPWIVPLG